MLICLAVARVLRGADTKHHWLWLCYARPGHLFLYLSNQPATVNVVPRLFCTSCCPESVATP